MKKNLFLSKKFFIILLLGLILRSFWFFTPLEVDEGVYALHSSHIKNNFDLPKSYLMMEKSPIVYFAYMLPLFIEDHSFIIYRIYGVILFVLGIILSIKTTYLFSKNEDEAYISGILFILLMSVPIYQGFLNKVGIIYILLYYLSLIFLNKILRKYDFANFCMFLLFYFLTTLTDPRVFYLSFFHIYLLYKKRKNFPAKTVAWTGIFILSFFVMVYCTLKSIYGIDLIGMAIKRIYILAIGYYANPYQHNIYFKYIPLFALQITPIIFFTILGYYNFNLLKNVYREIFFSCFIFLFLILILPTYGHYVLNILPLFILFSSRLITILKKKIRLGLVICFILTLISSFPFYPNMNISEIDLEFSGFSSYEAQTKIVNFLNENLNENESFYYYGWNNGLFWLANRYKATRYLFNCTDDSPYRYLKDLNNYYEKIEYNYAMKYILVERNGELDGCFNKIYGGYNLEYIDEIGLIKIYKIL